MGWYRLGVHAALVLVALVTLAGDWQYARTAPGDARPNIETEWSDDLDEWHSGDLWFRNRLPQALPLEPHLVFRAYSGDFSLFVGDRQIYDFREDAARGRLRLHVVPLPRDSAGQPIYVNVHKPNGPPFFSSPRLVARAELPSAIHETSVGQLREDLLEIALGIFLIVVGVISIAVWSVVRRAGTQALFWFGAMAALYGARLALDSHLPYLLGAPAQSIAFATASITYLINIPGWALACALIGDGWKSSLRWQLYLFMLFAPVAIAVDWVTGRPEALRGANNILVIVGGVNIFLNLIAARRRTIEFRVILAGALVFLAFALANNLASLGLLPWPEVDEIFGFVAFVSGLGFAATRSFLRAERERVAIEGELATAREIQRSILPTTMPAVPGLRFHAHYDPASSVAGDLYDFLPIDDARTGVIVADVSGHGVPAALVASMVKIAVSSQARLADDPAAMLRELNRTLRREVRRGFVTATYLCFDSARGTVDVANAGHPLPLLARDGEVRELGPHGVLLGRFDAAYTSERIALRPGDRIVAYTDGIVEARNARGEEFGVEWLMALVRRGGASEELANAIAEEVREWRGGVEDVDDVTLVVIDVVA